MSWLTEQPGKEAITRAEAIKPLLESSAWSALDERLNVVLQPISSAGTPLEEEGEKLASNDGDESS